MPHVIVVTHRANYFPILLLFLDSMKRSYPNRPEIVVLQKDFSREQIDSLQKANERLRVLNMTEHTYLKGPPMLNRQDCDVDSFYARFLIWTDLFAAYDNVLYLDIDAFVTGSLDALFAAQEFLCFQDAYAGPQPFFYDHTDPLLVERLREDGLTLPAKGGNAGVLLIPRRYRTPEQIALLTRLRDRYASFLIWGDQSLINLWMAANGLRPTKDYRYNFQARLLQQGGEMASYRDVRFFHMNGWNHLDCTAALIRTTWAFFFQIPGGRMVFPACFWVAMRADTCRLRFGIRVFMEALRLASVSYRRARRMLGFPSLPSQPSQSGGTRARQV